jgi:hypothetical protein
MSSHALSHVHAGHAVRLAQDRKLALEALGVIRWSWNWISSKAAGIFLVHNEQLGMCLLKCWHLLVCFVR